MTTNTDKSTDAVSFDTTLASLNLPIDLHWHLKKLALSHEAFSDCLKAIDVAQFKSSDDLIVQLRKSLNGYFDELWDLGLDDKSFSDGLWGSPKDRKFQYVADAVIPDIFSTVPALCAVCNDEKAFTVRHWQYPQMLTICSDCIENNHAFKKYKTSFHPQHRFNWNTSAPFHQIYLLTARTPPIRSFCENQEPYRWVRHCGDFALYQGDVHPSTLDYALVDELCSAEGADTDEMLEWWDGNYGNSVIHKFDCLYCKETLYSLDYSL